MAGRLPRCWRRRSTRVAGSLWPVLVPWNGVRADGVRDAGSDRGEERLQPLRYPFGWPDGFGEFEDGAVLSRSPGSGVSARTNASNRSSLFRPARSCCAGDAHVLADRVRTDAHQLRPVIGESALVEGSRSPRGPTRT